jgi:hypothetical protein
LLTGGGYQPPLPSISDRSQPAIGSLAEAILYANSEDKAKPMAIWDRFAQLVNRGKAIWTVIGWFGLAGTVVGTVTAIGGTVWAMITGISAPIVIMAAFCTLTAGIYLGLVPMAYRALLRFQEMEPTRARPDTEIWRHLSEFKLYEAACLFADIDPDIPTVSKPGDANGWYRALCQAINNGEIHHVPTPFDNQNTFMVMSPDGGMTGKTEYRPYEETVITRDDLKKFATKCGLRRGFLA